jgi:demethylmenaquinone methyltransferase/2-methoxy-6-polyprenyl-1,4-benzoquinol methylase
MPRGDVVGLDLTMPMLRAGKARLTQRPEHRRVRLVQADALCLPFADATFDCLTSAFTVRNLPDLNAAFREQARVVKPGGRVVCLELTWPRSPLMRATFPIYFGRLVPLFGRLLAGDAEAYSYLPASVRAFPAPDRLATVMRGAGLDDVRWRALGLGTVALHVGRAPKPASGSP